MVTSRPQNHSHSSRPSKNFSGTQSAGTRLVHQGHPGLSQDLTPGQGLVNIWRGRSEPTGSRALQAHPLLSCFHKGHPLLF